MDTIDVIKSRQSIRSYVNKKVPREILEDIVDCARLAPTGYNNQPWVFVVIDDEEIKNNIADVARSGKFIREAGSCIAVFCEKNAETALEDACAATENIIIAAQAYGLGTCWVNSYKKEHAKDIKKILDCPHEMELMTLLAIGYHNQVRKNKSKKSLTEVLKWNKH